jgi:hypothetical protein
MTLKEKFTEEIFNSSYQVLNPSKFVKIADDYAIEFVEWLVRFGNVRATNGNWIITMDFNDPLTTKEALELFKKEKGL